ncbi:tetratricopeptide repeat protein [Marinomonas sp. M1K-6]|uniref:Ancillary SecYEG translocon subunit n=1 Tax=Marinomonas profundi TaxID=2726122 RepID=A0A847R056_9GAMM|nr:tetratricopeptide repeat protein [Marinomonas profundi]NLQ16831.1 tetratricopeptide repeat protein [Marinomonas profundi]UDV02563.1 tetratricopeptide repeat protein [Marinomonas profundi]
MSELKTEEEQIEAFKTWWKKNGIALVVVIAAGVGGYFGWQAWKTSQANYVSEASALYQNLLQASADLSDENNQKTVSFIAKQLTDDYADTGYAMFGQLFLARVDAENGLYDDAIQALDLAIANTDDVTFTAVANLRVARLLLQKEDYTGAIARAEKVTAEEFAAQQQELIGDALILQGKRDDARLAYQKASEALGVGVNHPLLDIKLKDLVKG